MIANVASKYFYQVEMIANVASKYFYQVERLLTLQASISTK
jgi:hypothetical protein